MDAMGAGPPEAKGEKSLECIKFDTKSPNLVRVGSPDSFALINCSAPVNPGFAMSSRPNSKHGFFNSYLMFLSNDQVIEEILTSEKPTVSQNLR